MNNNPEYRLLVDQGKLAFLKRLAEIEAGSGAAVSHIEKTVELAKSPSMLYKTASPEKKRELLQTLLSNLTVSGKNVEMTLALPFRLIAERRKISKCGASRGTCRTWDKIIKRLTNYFTTEGSPAN